jgi:hypothetical protein
MLLYDPSDINMAMDECGTLYYRTSELSPGVPGIPEWAPLNELHKPTEKDFRRPIW